MTKQRLYHMHKVRMEKYFKFEKRDAQRFFSKYPMWVQNEWMKGSGVVT